MLTDLQTLRAANPNMKWYKMQAIWDSSKKKGTQIYQLKTTQFKEISQVFPHSVI